MALELTLRLLYVVFRILLFLLTAACLVLEILLIIDWNGDLELYFSSQRYRSQGIISYFDAVIVFGTIVSSYYIVTIGRRRWVSGPHLIDEILDISLCLLFLSSGITNLYPTFSNMRTSPFQCNDNDIITTSTNRCLFRQLEKYLGWILAVLYLIMFCISHFTYKYRRANVKPLKPQAFSPETHESGPSSRVDGRKDYDTNSSVDGSESFQQPTSFSNYVGTAEVGGIKNDYYESHNKYHTSDTNIKQSYSSPNIPPLPPSASSTSSYSSSSYGFGSYNYGSELRAGNHPSSATSSSQQQTRPPLEVVSQSYSAVTRTPSSAQYTQNAGAWYNAQVPIQQQEQQQYVRGTRQYYYQEAQGTQPYRQESRNIYYQQQYQQQQPYQQGTQDIRQTTMPMPTNNNYYYENEKRGRSEDNSGSEY